jgi:8-oxo-dGTP pyrophosphatase MutT (NUDIX family)
VTELPPPIAAATVVVIRDGDDGIETLMLRRNARGPFGGMWVFPGGKVDPTDEGVDELARARVAAAREAYEEAGVRLDPNELTVHSHWLPPPVVARRFSTWFFLAPLPADGAEVIVDGTEIHDHAWLAAAEVMRRRDAGEVELAPPTWVTLHSLVRHPNVAAAVAAAQAAEPERFMTQIALVDGTRVAMWRGDAGYEFADPTATGARHRLVMADDGWRYERSD